MRPGHDISGERIVESIVGIVDEVAHRSVRRHQLDAQISDVAVGESQLDDRRLDPDVLGHGHRLADALGIVVWNGLRSLPLVLDACQVSDGLRLGVTGLRQTSRSPGVDLPQAEIVADRETPSVLIHSAVGLG